MKRKLNWESREILLLIFMMSFLWASSGNYKEKKEAQGRSCHKDKRFPVIAWRFWNLFFIVDRQAQGIFSKARCPQ